MPVAPRSDADIRAQFLAGGLRFILLFLGILFAAFGRIGFEMRVIGIGVRNRQLGKHVPDGFFADGGIGAEDRIIHIHGAVVAERHVFVCPAGQRGKQFLQRPFAERRGQGQTYDVGFRILVKGDDPVPDDPVADHRGLDREVLAVVVAFPAQRDAVHEALLFAHAAFEGIEQPPDGDDFRRVPVGIAFKIAVLFLAIGDEQRLGLPGRPQAWGRAYSSCRADPPLGAPA